MEDEEHRKCKGCLVFKQISEFGKDSSRKDGKNIWCKECNRSRQRQIRLEKKSAGTSDYVVNRERLLAAANEYYRKNKIKVLDAARLRRELHPEREKEYKRKRMRSPRERINRNVSGAIRQHIKKGSKAGRRWETLVGYTVETLKQHLESLFQPGMSWSNYGEWHIDHIIPLSAHNYETPEHIDFKRAWAISNLQPLWASDNMSKHARLNGVFQPSLLI